MFFLSLSSFHTNGLALVSVCIYVSDCIIYTIHTYTHTHIPEKKRDDERRSRAIRMMERKRSRGLKACAGRPDASETALFKYLGYRFVAPIKAKSKIYLALTRMRACVHACVRMCARQVSCASSYRK